MIRACTVWIVLCLLNSVVLGSEPVFPKVDSIVETCVQRYEEELRSYVRSGDDIEFASLLGITDFSSFGELALNNFQIFFEARLHYFGVREPGYSFDTTSHSDQLGVLLGYGVSINLWKIDQAISKIEIHAGGLERPVVAQAARDLLNAWKDIRDMIMRKYPYLQEMKEIIQAESDSASTSP